MKKLTQRLFLFLMVLAAIILLLPLNYLNAQEPPTCNVVVTELHEQYMDRDTISISAENLDTTTYTNLQAELHLGSDFSGFSIFSSPFSRTDNNYDLRVGTNTLTLIIWNDEP